MTDLIVVKITNPPGAGVSALASPLRTIVGRSSRPLLTVPQQASRFNAYDGTDRSREALFVAAYFAETWKTELIVFTALDGRKITADTQDYARRYLEFHEVEAEYILSERGAMDALKETVQEHNVDLVLMGSHGETSLSAAICRQCVGPHAERIKGADLRLPLTKHPEAETLHSVQGKPSGRCALNLIYLIHHTE